MKKVCMLSISGPGLIYDSRICREANSLAKQYDVVLLDICEKPDRRYYSFQKFRIRRAALRLKRLPNRILFLPIKYAEYVIVAAVQAFRERADIYHAHDLHCLVPAFLAAKMVGKKVVYDSHEFYTEVADMPALEKKAWKSIEKRLSRRADIVIAANDSRAALMRKIHGLREQPEVILNAPPKTNFLPRAGIFDEQRAAGKKIVLYQGALSPGRGLEEVVRSAAYLGSGVILAFIGYGIMIDRLKAIAAELGVSDKILWMGAVSADQLAPYTASAHVGLVTYQPTCLNNFYCAPNKLFEYAMAGIPVAGADLPEIRRIVELYAIGTLFDPYRPESIAAAINEITGSDLAYLERKTNTEKVRMVFNWENEEKKLFGLYERLHPHA